MDNTFNRTFEDYLPLKEAGESLTPPLSYAAMYKHYERGTIKAVKRGGIVWVARIELRRFAEARRKPGPPIGTKQKRLKKTVSIDK